MSIRRRPTAPLLKLDTKVRARKPVSESLHQQILALYQAVEEEWGMDDPTDAWFQEYTHDHHNRHANQPKQYWAHVKRWWTEPERYSPYLDEVALTRAFRDFDGKVIANLSEYEWQTFITQMLNDPAKPWEDAAPTKGLNRHTGKSRRVLGGVHVNESWLSDRSRAWFRLPEEQREAIQRAMTTRKERYKRERERSERDV